MEDLATWRDWVQEGALVAFAVFVCWVGYKLVTHGGKKALELGERYIKSTEDLHDTLRDAEDNRQKLCERHANGIEALALKGTDIDRMKRAALQACRMCREISDKEIPNSAAEVARHCNEIERVLGEA